MFFILASLASAMYYLIKDKGHGTRAVKSLTLRIGLSVLLFALLMLAAAISMIRSESKTPVPAIGKERRGGLLIQGLLIGAITGLLGAGGGFLIIPALVLISRLPMKIAVGSSLTIMALSSFFGFFSTLSHYTINWFQLLTFTGIAVLGIFIGTAFSEKIPGQSLKKGFGWFVMAIGLFILIHELCCI